MHPGSCTTRASAYSRVALPAVRSASVNVAVQAVVVQAILLARTRCPVVEMECVPMFTPVVSFAVDTVPIFVKYVPGGQSLVSAQTTPAPMRSRAAINNVFIASPFLMLDG